MQGWRIHRRDGATVRRCDGATVRRCNGATARRCDGAAEGLRTSPLASSLAFRSLFALAFSFFSSFSFVDMKVRSYGELTLLDMKAGVSEP